VELYLDDELQRQICFELYEQPLARHLRKVLRKGSVIYDIGANVGFFTLLASELVGGEGEVHAFEPVPADSESLARNIEQDNVQNVILNEIAVSSKLGSLTLFLPDVAINIPVGIRSFHLFAAARSSRYLRLRLTTPSVELGSVHRTSSRSTARGRSLAL
jgi:FkbM family methyltransferase